MKCKIHACIEEIETRVEIGARDRDRDRDRVGCRHGSILYCILPSTDINDS
jgi:hypothetical protein